MKTFFKGILWLFAGLLILLVATIGIAFVVFDSDTLKSQAISLVKEQTSADLTIGQDLSLKLFPWLKIESGDIKLSNPKGFSGKLNALEIKELSASIKLMPLFKGKIEIGEIEFDGSQLNLIRDRKGRSNIDVMLTIAKDSQIKSPQATEATDTESKTDLASLSISRINLNDFTLNQYSPKQKITQSFALQQLEINQFAFDQWTPIDAKGQFKSGSGKTEAKWQLSTQIKLDSEIKKIALKQVKASMTDISNKLTSLALTGDSQIILNNKNTQVTHSGQLNVDDQLFEMELESTFSTYKNIKLKLNTDTLNLAPWIAAANGDNVATDGQPLDTKPIADFLKSARISGVLAINKLLVNDIAFNNVSADLSNKGSTLWLKPFKAKAFKGDLSTNASINFAARPLAFSIAPSLQKIEVGDLISQVFDVQRLSGLGDLSLNMRTKGINSTDMLRNLSGTGSINLSDGALLGLDLNKLIESGISLQLLNGAKAYDGKTNFAELSGKVLANKGVINLNDLSLQSPLFDLVGKASTNAHKESLAGNFKLQLKGALKQALESKYPQLAGVDLPFELKGTWSEPRPSIDFESLLKARFQKEVETKVDDKIEEEKEKLKDKLKDELFKKLKFD